MNLLASDLYQPRLQSRFVLVRNRLRALLPAGAIEHIGVSAIPGAVSKGDLDICVRVTAPDHAGAIEALVAAGYSVKPDTLRTADLCMLEWHIADEAHAVQLVVRDAEFDLFVAFRDALRADPALVQAYNNLKAATAAGPEDDYRNAKAAFIENVLAADARHHRSAGTR